MIPHATVKCNSPRRSAYTDPPPAVSTHRPRSGWSLKSGDTGCQCAECARRMPREITLNIKYKKFFLRDPTDAPAVPLTVLSYWQAKETTPITETAGEKRYTKERLRLTAVETGISRTPPSHRADHEIVFPPHGRESPQHRGSRPLSHSPCSLRSGLTHPSYIDEAGPTDRFTASLFSIKNETTPFCGYLFLPPSGESLNYRSDRFDIIIRNHQ